MGNSSAAKLAMTATSSGELIRATAPSMISITERKRASLFGLYVADATAMPVHWMYDTNQLKRDYGTIRGYVQPKDRFDGSIMNLSNTGGGGRGSDQGDIVGSVILHGKKKYWLRGGNFHYHLGLQAGENTLEAQLTRLLTRSITELKSFSVDDFLTKYASFMQTPGSHNDTYASTAHRMFFANVLRGKPLKDCADNDGHNTDAIDALTLTVPVILKYAEAPREERNMMTDDAFAVDTNDLLFVYILLNDQWKVRQVVRATRKSTALNAYADAFADLLVAVLQGNDLRSAVERCGSALGGSDGLVRSVKTMVERSRGDPMVACYIESSFPALLFFAYKYADSPEEAILANANAGGENVARGSLLGALLGAAHGVDAFPAWSQELHGKDQINAEIDEFLASL
eukprot:gene4373-8709_t